jgi:hypothetical protein
MYVLQSINRVRQFNSIRFIQHSGIGNAFEKLFFVRNYSRLHLSSSFCLNNHCLSSSLPASNLIIMATAKPPVTKVCKLKPFRHPQNLFSKIERKLNIIFHLQEDGVTQLDDLIPVCGGCCIITSLYTLYPECVGSYGAVTFTCFEWNYKACKISTRPEDLCICISGECMIIRPTTCLKGVTQCFCLDNRCAMPCDDDVPCIVNFLGLNCLYTYACACKCCTRIGEIKSGFA